MVALSERHYLGVLDVVRAAALGTADDLMPDIALLAAERLFPQARSVAFCVGPIANRPVRRIFTRTAPISADVSRAMDRYRHQNPMRATVASLGRGQRISDHISRRAYRRLDLYQAVGRPLGVEFGMELWLRPPGQPLQGWVLGATDRDFDDRDRDVLELLGRQVAALIESVQRRRSTRGRGLTTQEVAVLRLVAQGHGNAAISALLGISPYTVRTHLENAFSRLEVRTRAAAVAAAFT